MNFPIAEGTKRQKTYSNAAILICLLVISALLFANQQSVYAKSINFQNILEAYSFVLTRQQELERAEGLVSAGESIATKDIQAIVGDLEVAIKFIADNLDVRTASHVKILKTLELQAEAVVTNFSATSGSSANLTKALDALGDLQASQRSITTAVGRLRGLSAKLRNLSNKLGAVGTLLEAGNAIFSTAVWRQAVSNGADEFEQTQLQFDAALSTAKVTIAIASGGLSIAAVAAAEATVAVGERYADLLGDAVRDEVLARQQGYYSAIMAAEQSIYSEIRRRNNAGNPLSSNEINALVKRIFDKVISDIESSRDDIGLLERVFGVSDTSTDAIYYAVELATALRNKSLPVRAQKFQDKIILAQSIERAAKEYENLPDASLASTVQKAKTIAYSYSPQLEPSLDTCATFDCDNNFQAETTKEGLVDQEKALLAEENKPTAAPLGLPGFASITGYPVSGGYPNFSGVWMTEVEPLANGYVRFSAEGNRLQDVTGREFVHNEGLALDNIVWGEWNGGSRTYSRSHDNAEIGNLHGYFLYGSPSIDLPQDFKASYSGRLKGDFIDGNTQTITRGGIDGQFGLTANLSNSSITGWMEFYRLGTASAFAVADIAGISIYRDGGQTAFDGQLTGNNINGGIAGAIYGDEGQEVGGSYWLDAHNDAAGVFAGTQVINMPDRPADPVLPGVPVAALGGASGAGNSFFTNEYRPQQIPALGAGRERINLSPGVDLNVDLNRGAYAHVAWGEWNRSDFSLSNGSTAPGEKGFIAVGVATRPENLPSGRATYSGEIGGFGGPDNERIGGSVALTADFTNRNIGGQFHFNRANGTRWVDVQTPNMILSNDGDSVSFRSFGGFTVRNPSGAVIPGADAAIGGRFYGPAGEEIAGDWAVWNTGDAVGLGDGVFRAKK